MSFIVQCFHCVLLSRQCFTILLQKIYIKKSCLNLGKKYAYLIDWRVEDINNYFDSRYLFYSLLSDISVFFLLLLRAIPTISRFQLKAFYWFQKTHQHVSLFRETFLSFYRVSHHANLLKPVQNYVLLFNNFVNTVICLFCNLITSYPSQYYKLLFFDWAVTNNWNM